MVRQLFTASVRIFLVHLHFFYKQPVYTPSDLAQLALKWQIAKQLSRLNHLSSLSNKKTAN